jgi:hypothetical protein
MDKEKETAFLMETSIKSYEALSEENKDALKPYFNSGIMFLDMMLRTFNSFKAFAVKELVGRKIDVFNLLEISRNYDPEESHIRIIRDKKALTALKILFKQFGSRNWSEVSGHHKELLSFLTILIELELENNNIDPSEDLIEETLHSLFYRTVIGGNPLQDLPKLNQDSRILNIFRSIKSGDFEDRLPKNGVRYSNLKKAHEFREIELYLIHEMFIDPVTYEWPEKKKIYLKALCIGLHQSEFFDRYINGVKINSSHIERYLEARYLINISGLYTKKAKYDWFNEHFSVVPFFLKKIGPTK